MRLLRRSTTVGLVVASLCCGVRARAQSPADLAAGRQTFVEALADEEQGRYADAITKYRRVLLVRDTPNIRYRIGASLERLGKLVQAADSYEAAVKLGTASGTTADADVARASRERISAIAPKLAHLTLRVPSAPPGTEVTVDGEPARAEPATERAVDPGTHVVAASAPGRRPFRSSVDLTEGARVELPIVLEPQMTVQPVPTPVRVYPYRTAGIVTAAAGGALLASGVIVLAVRSGTLGDLETACPNGACPQSRRDELQSAHDRARTEGPLGVALVAVGAAAMATGLVLVFIGGSEAPSALRLVPVPVAHGGLLTFGKDL